MERQQQQKILSQSSSESQISQEKPKIKKNTTKSTRKIVVNTSDCQYVVVTRVCKQLGWKTQTTLQSNDWDVMWTDNAVQGETLLRMGQHQKINHFPGMFNLARKNLLGRNLMRMRKKFPNDYSFFPLTWMLPVEFHELKAYFQTKEKGKARTFIVKPQALSQGKGIYLTRKLEDIDQYQHCIVQRYLHRPYLIEGLKFDLRIYVLLAGVDPLRIYLFKQGLGRFATQTYQPPSKDNMDEVCMHLTNYAINKDNPKFIFNQSEKDMSKGHKRSLTSVLQLLRSDGVNTDELMSKIKTIITKTIISGLPVLANTFKACQPDNYSGNMCFELLGFDVMLTDKADPILLEINHTPSFTIDTPLDTYIKTNYIKDALILMNINHKNRSHIMKSTKQACQQRIITGKKQKVTNQERQKLKLIAQEERDKYQAKHQGGFEKIFPTNDSDLAAKYNEFYKYAEQCYLKSTGATKIKRQQSSVKDKQLKKQKTILTQKQFKKQPDFIKFNMMFDKKTQNKTNHNFQSNKNISFLEENKNSQYRTDNYINDNPQTNPIQKNIIQDQKQTFFPDKTCNEHSETTENIKPQEIDNVIFFDVPKVTSNKINTKNYPIKVLYKNKCTYQTSLKSNLLNLNPYTSNDMENPKETREDIFAEEDHPKKRPNYKDTKSQPRTINYRQKIPITLNTLLITGLQSNGAVAMNMKKIINQQKHKNYQ